MRAYVIEEPGGPEKLVLRDVPAPDPVEGSALIRVRAFGLNRSEWFTRRGDSPSVHWHCGQSQQPEAKNVTKSSSAAGGVLCCRGG